MTLPERLATLARSIVDSLTKTDYQHNENIDAAAGIYECDCNGFVGFVLQKIAPEHYASIPKEATQPRPRAFEYYMFLASLLPDAAGGWRRIDLLSQARAGDVIAWRFPTIKLGHDTGHVLLVAETPTTDSDGIVSVTVSDSAAEPHFNDTRGTGAGIFPNGVGRGVIKFRTDGAGRPIAFQFAPPTSAEFSFLDIAIGRVEAT